MNGPHSTLNTKKTIIYPVATSKHLFSFQYGETFVFLYKIMIVKISYLLPDEEGPVLHPPPTLPLPTGGPLPPPPIGAISS